MRPSGFKHTAETKGKIRIASTGKGHSEESKDKIRKKALGNKRSLGVKRTKEQRLKSSIDRKGKNLREESFHWKGGRIKRSGYIQILLPSHPHCNKYGYIREHRVVMEKHLGRFLIPTEIVHHINGIKDDNRIENLMLFSSQKEHGRHHVPKGKRIGEK